MSFIETTVVKISNYIFQQDPDRKWKFFNLIAIITQFPKAKVSELAEGCR